MKRLALAAVVLFTLGTHSLPGEAKPWLTNWGPTTSLFGFLNTNFARRQDLELGRTIRALELFWQKELGKYQIPFSPAKVVIFDGEIQTGCGPLDQIEGLGYCPKEKTIYVSPRFWEFIEQELRSNNFGSRVYILAHEYGHHVQHEVGLLHVVQKYQRAISKKEKAQLRQLMEAGADAFAGYFMKSLLEDRLIGSRHVKASKRLAERIGDDSKDLPGMRTREKNHGTGAERLYWFERGLNAQNMGEADPFEDLNTIGNLAPYLQKLFSLSWISPTRRGEGLSEAPDFAALIRNEPLLLDHRLNCEQQLTD